MFYCILGKFKRVSIIAVPTSRKERRNEVDQGGARPNLFKRRRIRHRDTTRVPHIKRLRLATKTKKKKIKTGAGRQQVKTANMHLPPFIRRPRNIGHRPVTHSPVSHNAHRRTAVTRLPARGRRARRVRRR